MKKSIILLALVILMLSFSITAQATSTVGVIPKINTVPKISLKPMNSVNSIDIDQNFFFITGTSFSLSDVKDSLSSYMNFRYVLGLSNKIGVNTKVTFVFDIATYIGSYSPFNQNVYVHGAYFGIQSEVDFSDRLSFQARAFFPAAYLDTPNDSFIANGSFFDFNVKYNFSQNFSVEFGFTFVDGFTQQ